VLPDFLRESDKSARGDNLLHCDENFDCGKIPSEDEAEAFFATGSDIGPFTTALGGSMNSLAFSETSSCSSLFRDVTNQTPGKQTGPIPYERKRLQAMSTSSETDPHLLNNESTSRILRTSESSELLRKRQSLTQADLIDLPSPPKTKKISPPKATVV